MRKQHSSQRSVVLVKASKISVTESPCSVSPVAPFPLFLHHICWDVYFCYTLSRHVSFHSLLSPWHEACKQAVIILRMAMGQETSVDKPVLQNKTKCTMKSNTMDGFSFYPVKTLSCHSDKSLTSVCTATNELRLTCAPLSPSLSTQTWFTIILLLHGFLSNN